MGIVSTMLGPRWTLTLTLLGLFASLAPQPAVFAAPRVTAIALQQRVTELATRLDDPDPARRGAAGIELMAIKDPRAVPFLLDAIKAVPVEHRLPLVRALARFKVSTKIALFIAFAREPGRSDGALLAEIRTQLQALGPGVVAPLFAAVTRCDSPSEDMDWDSPGVRESSVSEWMAATAGGVGPAALPRMFRAASSASRCRRWAAVQAFESFTGEDKPWTGPELQQVCAALERATADRAAIIRKEATRILDHRRESGICYSHDSSVTERDSSIEDHAQRRLAFEQALASKDPKIRRGAIDRLFGGSTISAEDLQPSEATPRLTPLIAPLVSDVDEAIRLHAVQLLHALNARKTNWRDEEPRDPADSVPALLIALHDKSAEVRRAALKGLAEVTPEGDSSFGVSEELLTLVPASDPDDYQTILDALTTLHDSTIAPKLLTWLDDEDVDTRYFAATVLGSCGSIEMVPLLAPLLKEEDADVRRAAASSIKDLIDNSGQPTPAVVGALVEPMIAGLDDTEPVVRYVAINVLGRSRDPRAVEPLIRVLPQTVTEGACRACWPLGNIGDPRAIDALRPYLAHESKEIRLSAAWAISGVKDDRVVEPLKSILRDPDIRNRHDAVKMLAAVGRPAAIAAVRSIALSDEEASMRTTAVQALRAFPGPETDATLMRVLKDRDVDVRQAAAWLLRDIAQPGTAAALIEALTDEDMLVRRHIAETLGKLGDRRAVEPLLHVLPYTLPDAARALGQLGDARAVDALIAVARSPQADHGSESEAAALAALGQLGDPRALPIFVRALRSTNYKAPEVAREILMKQRDPRAVALLSSRLLEIARPGGAWSNEEYNIRALLNALCDPASTIEGCQLVRR
jgi:HEAT repeat protein